MSHILYHNFVHCCYFHFTRSMHNSESGRKINQAVNQTTKAVGGALATAKSTFTSFWNSISTGTTTTRDGQEFTGRDSQDVESAGVILEDEEDIPKRGRIESCVEALPIGEVGQESTDTKPNKPTKNDVEQPRRRKESTKEELEEIIQKTADKLIEYAKEVDPDFENRKGKVFTV